MTKNKVDKFWLTGEKQVKRTRDCYKKMNKLRKHVEI